MRSAGGIARISYEDEAVTVALEGGYASGDNDPQDDVVRQFTFNTAYTVGMVLFQHVLPMVTARSADRLMDPGLLAESPSGMRFTVNQGAVRNAAYLNPTLVWRMMPGWAARLAA